MPQPNELTCIVNDTLPPKTYTNTTVLTYAIPFPFVNQNDVVVISRNGNVDTILENQAFNASGTYTINQGVNPALVTFTAAPGADELIITRMTDICKMLVVYEAGASIRAEDLNAGNTQLLHLIQENYGLIKELEERIGTLLTTPLYQVNPVQNESSWTNERIPSGAAALAQLNTTVDTADPGVGNYYDGKLWFQPSNTTQATAVGVEFLPGSSTSLAPAWPGGNDLDSIPNTVQTYDFNQNVSGTGTNLKISVSIVNSVITVVTIINGGESWDIGDTAETGNIAVSNGGGNTGTIRLRATVTNVAPGLSFLKVRDQGQWKTISSNDPSTNPFIPAQTYYVNTQGNDSNSGLTPSTAFRTIKKAVFECNKLKGVAQTLTFETAGANVPVYNNTNAVVGGVPAGFIRYTCTSPHGLDTGDIVTIPQSVWNCAQGNENYPTAGPTQFAITVVPGEPNNLYIDVGPTPTAHTFVSTVNANPGFNNQIPVRQARVGDNFQIQVAPGSYAEMMPIVIYAKNLCITGSSLRNTYVHPRIVAGVQPDGSAYTPASLGNVTDDKGNTIQIWDTEVRTMFYCDSGTYINNMTVCGIKSFFTRDANGNVIRGGAGSIDPSPTYGLPVQQGWIAALRPSDATLGALVDGSVPAAYTNNVPGSFISKSPYIQNCTNFSDINIDNGPAFNPQFLTGEGGDTASAPTGGGILCDGASPSVGSPLRSFVVDAFTQVALNGPGILATNKGYAQLVSFFGTFCWYHAKALNGAQLNLSNCTTDFGQYGLIADNGTMTGGTPSNPHVFDGQIDGAVVAATPPDNVQVLSVNNAFWNNTNAVQNAIPAGQIKLQVTTATAPVVGQTLKLSNLTFAEWDATAPTNPDQGDPDPTGTGAYVGNRIKVPGIGEASSYVISSVANTAGNNWDIFFDYKQENLNLGATNTYDAGAYTNTTSGGQQVFAGFIQDQNTGVASIQLPTAGTGAGVPSIFIRVDNLGNASNLWQQPRKPEPGPTQLIEIQHTEGSVFYPILSANKVSATEFDLEIYAPYSSFDRRNLGLVYAAADNMVCRFYLQSYISTGGHTFEFVGSGTDYDAHPDLGGEGVQANQAVELGGVVATAGTAAKQAQINNITKYNQGRVWLSSTDEVGTFQVGDTFIVNQKTGQISIDPSVIVSPKLDVTEDLDMKQWGIVTTFGTDTNLLLQPKGTGGLVISNSEVDRPADGPSTSPIIGPLQERTTNNPQPKPTRDWDVVTKQDIGYDPDEVPVCTLLGELAFTNSSPSVAFNTANPKPNEVNFTFNQANKELTLTVYNATAQAYESVTLTLS